MKSRQKTKRPMSEAQRSALEKAQAKRRANLAAKAEEVSLPQEIVYGSTEPALDDLSPVVGDDGFVDPFQLFLLSLDADTRELLDEGELRAIYAEQLAKALAEKKTLKKKAAIETALHTARMEAGLVPAATAEAMQTAKRNAEIVTAMIELPPAGEDGQVADIGLRIDQKVYLHGHRYEFSRAQWDSYREILYRAAQHELEFKGQNTRQRRYLLGMAMGTVNSHIARNPDGGLA